MAVNWNALNPPADVFGAFEAGRQHGRAVKAQSIQDNALAALDMGNEQAMNALVAVNPELGLKFQKQQAEQQEQHQIQQLAMAAFGGDQQAEQQLAIVAPDLWKTLKTRHDEGMSAVGNIAYQVSLLPEDQRAQAWDQGVEYLAQQFPDLAQYKGQYSPQALAGVLAQTGMTEKAQEAIAPHYVAVPAGGGVTNINPNSPGFNPAQANTVAQGPQVGQVEDGYRFRGGNPADPDSWEQVGGAPSQGGATFP